MHQNDKEVLYKQEKVLILLKNLNDIDKKNKLDYMLGYGSALGAVRHKGFIPWDYDMDILVPYKKYREFREKFIHSNQNKNIKLMLWDKEKKFHPAFDRIVFNNFDHEYTHIDVYPLIGAPRTYIFRKIFVSICYYSYKILQCKYKNTKYSKLNNVRKIKFIKFFMFFIPNFIRKTYIKIIYNLFDYEKTGFVYNLNSGYKHKDVFMWKDIKKKKKVKFENLLLPLMFNHHKYLSSIYDDYMTPKKY